MIELRRQIFHLFMGVLIVLLLMLKIINAKIIFIVLIAGGILSLLRVWNLN